MQRELLIGLLKMRLSLKDCQYKGFILLLS